MTALSISELPSGSTLLALLAAVLLVFVSVGVLYLSTVEWRDRRRRQNSEPALKRPTPKRPTTKAAGSTPTAVSGASTRARPFPTGTRS